MSRNASSHRQIVDASRVAVTADHWITGPKHFQSLVDDCGEVFDDAEVDRIIKLPRIRRRYDNAIAPLLHISLSHPKLAKWLASGKSLRKLSLFAGAALASGTISRFIEKEDLDAIALAIGSEALEFGLAQEDDKIAMAATVPDVIAFIETEGEQCVGSHLQKIAPNLASQIMCAAGLSFDMESGPNDAAYANALAAALEGTEP